MTRSTSKEAYEEIKSSGVLSQRLFQTYEAVYLHPRSTRNELYARLPHHNAEGTYGRALSMLVHTYGLVTVPQDPQGHDLARICTVSGSKCVVYEVAPIVPSKDDLKNALASSKRPPTVTIAKAVADLRTLVRNASLQDPSFKISPELLTVAKWLRSLSED
jgi:hypothetical protein